MGKEVSIGGTPQLRQQNKGGKDNKYVHKTKTVKTNSVKV